MTSIHVQRLASRVARTTARVVAEVKRSAGRGRPVEPDDLKNVRLPWFEVRSDYSDDGELYPTKQNNPTTNTIFIYDEIGGSLGVDANELVHQIEAMNTPTIGVRINSPGGSVFDAIAIYNALNHHPARILVWVDSIAASAASVIAMAGDEIVMMPGSQMMIHDASATEDGNSEDHRKLGVFLDRQSDNIADIYRMRAGGDLEKWRNLMLEETWAFAHEACDLGLADRVEAPPARIDAGEDERMTRFFDLSCYRYAGRYNAPAPGTGVRQHRAHTQPREADPVASRAEAAAARKRAFLEQSAVLMPDRSERRQTRGVTLGPDVGRVQPFTAQVRGQLEKRQGQDKYHLHGYATMFDRAYPMWDSFGQYEEKVRSGAADLTLARNPDVSFLVNHGGVTMARTTNGSLELSANQIGLLTDAWVNPVRSDVQIIMSAIDDELVTEMSFAFMIPEGGGWWSEDFTTFEIRQFDLDRGDVSAVNYGANPYTSIAARAREIMTHIDLLTPGMQRAFRDKLGSPVERRTRQLSLDMLEAAVLAPEPTPARDKVPAKQGRSLAAIERRLHE
jgi:ATP-dependent protease ClpP protease subunit/phage head maturation protease